MCAAGGYGHVADSGRSGQRRAAADDEQVSLGGVIDWLFWQGGDVKQGIASLIDKMVHSNL